MDTMFLIAAVVLFRYFLFLMKNHMHQGAKYAWFFIIFGTIIFCALPLVLIKKEIIENNMMNILIVGFSFFYFPFVAARIPEKDITG